MHPSIPSSDQNVPASASPAPQPTGEPAFPSRRDSLRLMGAGAALLGLTAFGNRAAAAGPAGGSLLEFAATALTMASMRALSPTGWDDGAIVVLEGYFFRGDGGGGLFAWHATDTTTDNSGTIIQLNGQSTGRLWRIGPGTTYNEISTTLDVRWFGAIPDYASNVTPYLAAAAAALPTNGFGTLYFPAGVYVFGSKLALAANAPGNLTLKGDGPSSTIFYNVMSNSGMIEIAGNTGLHDIGFINGNGSPNANDCVFLRDGNLRATNLHFSAFTNDACLHLRNGFAQISGVVTTNLDGCQLLVESCGGRVSNCFFSAGNGAGKTVRPCCIVQANPSGGAQTSLHIDSCSFKGQGPFPTYDGGGTASTIVLSSRYGPVHEGLITNVFIDTTSSIGTQQDTIGLLAEGRSNGSSDVSGWTVSNFYVNGCQDAIRLHGRDLGSGKNVSSFTISNIYSVGGNVGTTTGVHANFIDCCAVTLTGLHCADGSGLTDAVHIYCLENNYCDTFTISGVTSGAPAYPPNRTVVVCHGNVRNVFSIHHAANSGTPYGVQGGASKGNGLLFLWPNGSGGLNCSGSLAQNV
ncbi:MAG: hypothetical protein KF715_02950 [Candidatus Didemnitutus sp.]|nr:hypothetical protein [Candidatus Didemnitutus sp.]